MKQTAPALVSSLLHERLQAGGQDGLRVREQNRVCGDAEGRHKGGQLRDHQSVAVFGVSLFLLQTSLRGSESGGDKGDLGRVDSRAPPPRFP